MELVCKVFRLHVPFSQVLKQPKVQRYSQGLEYAHASVFGKSGVKALVPDRLEACLQFENVSYRWTHINTASAA